MKKKIKYVLITAICVCLMTSVAYAKSGTVNQETIRMRKEASTDSSIVTLISLNEKVEILSEEGDWYKVKYQKQTGYIRKDMLDVEGAKNTAENTVQNQTTNEVSSVNETNTENTVASNNEVQNTVSQNTTTENNQSENVVAPNNENETANNTENNTENTNTATTAENNEPSQNNTQESKNNEELQDGFKGKIVSKIELKIVPSINSSVICNLEENTEITLKYTMNKWCYIETTNNSGWVLKSKIKTQKEEVTENQNNQTNQEQNYTERKVEETAKPEETKQEATTAETAKTENTKTETTKTDTKKVTEVTKYVSAETLNMREKADNSSKIISQLKINAKVTVTEVSGTWSKIKVNGKTGYVASKYLSDKKVDVTSRSEETSRANTSKTSENNTSTSSEEKTKSSTNSSSTSSSGTTGSSIVSYAKQYLGYRYVSGGSAPSTGFDCSGFTSYVYKHFGISISRSSGAQASNGTAVSKSNLQAGDLVIFNNRSNSSIGHVGIYIGGNTFIHAGNSSTGVITTSLSDSYYSARYVTGRRIIN